MLSSQMHNWILGHQHNSGREDFLAISMHWVQFSSLFPHRICCATYDKSETMVKSHYYVATNPGWVRMGRNSQNVRKETRPRRCMESLFSVFFVYRQLRVSCGKLARFADGAAVAQVFILYLDLCRFSFLSFSCILNKFTEDCNFPRIQENQELLFYHVRDMLEWCKV